MNRGASFARALLLLACVAVLASCAGAPPPAASGAYAPVVRDEPDTPEEVACLQTARRYSPEALVVPESVRSRYPAGAYTRPGSEIQAVFTTLRSNLWREYFKVMRKRARDPSGHVILAVVVAPDGSVAHAEITETGLCNRELEAKILELVRGLKFSPVTQPGYFVFPYPIQLIPA